MDISGTTRVFMVVGDPVTQVQAPAIFNGVFRRFGVDAVLVPAQVHAAALAPFAHAVLSARNIEGLWLTIPHKTTLVDELVWLDNSARVARSVNAVRRNAAGALEGALFDGSGLVGALRHFGLAPEGLRVLLLGCGGAGAAIATALLEAGVGALGLHDLGARAQHLAQRLHGNGNVVPFIWQPGMAVSGFDVVINATPLGLHPEDPLPLDVRTLSPHTQVVDILMKHRPTPLLQACAERGIRAFAGFEMLVQQVPDYLNFFGLTDVAQAMRADLQEVRRALLVD